jgi:hypothetical protein
LLDGSDPEEWDGTDSNNGGKNQKKKKKSFPLVVVVVEVIRAGGANPSLRKSLQKLPVAPLASVFKTRELPRARGS